MWMLQDKAKGEYDLEVKKEEGILLLNKQTNQKLFEKGKINNLTSFLKEPENKEVEALTNQLKETDKIRRDAAQRDIQTDAEIKIAALNNEKSIQLNSKKLTDLERE